MMKKIRVAHIFDTYPMPFAPYFAEVFRRLDLNKKIDSSIYAFNTNDAGVNSLKFNLTKRVQHKLYSGLSSKKDPIFLTELLKNDPDIVHIQISYLYRKFGSSLERLAKEKKVVLTLRGGDTYVKPWMVEDLRAFYKKFGKLAYFVTMSRNQKDYLQQWGVPPERVHVISISHNNSPTPVNKEKANEPVLRIASVYRMTWEKNIQGAMLYIRQLTDMGINVCYDVYGDGVDLGEVYYLKDKLGLASQVNIKGKVAYDVLMEQLKQYHFILQLSISEALPSSILEGQSLGIPAVISDSGGLPEAAIPGATAICKPFWETEQLARDTATLWNNKPVYLEYCSRSIDHAQNFTAEKETERLVQLYSTIMAS